MFIEQQNKIAQKYLVLGPGARKNFSVIESYIIWIPFNVMSRASALFIIKK